MDVISKKVFDALLIQCKTIYEINVAVITSCIANLSNVMMKLFWAKSFPHFPFCLVFFSIDSTQGWTANKSTELQEKQKCKDEKQLGKVI